MKRRPTRHELATHINQRAAIVLMGSPGSGKTTLARALVERTPPSIIEVVAICSNAKFNAGRRSKKNQTIYVRRNLCHYRMSQKSFPRRCKKPGKTFGISRSAENSQRRSGCKMTTAIRGSLRSFIHHLFWVSFILLFDLSLTRGALSVDFQRLLRMQRSISANLFRISAAF